MAVHSPCPHDISPNTWQDARRLWGTGSINVNITEKPMKRNEAASAFSHVQCLVVDGSCFVYAGVSVSFKRVA